MIKRLKSIKITNIYAYNTLFKFKSRWKRALREWGFRLTLGFKRLILYVHKNLWHFGLKKNILNLVLKGVPEKYVGCLLVYPFYGSLFFLKKEKKGITGWWVWICYKAVPNESISY